MISFNPFPILYTERLILRQLKAEDEEPVFILRSDESVNTFIQREKATSLQDARAFIDKINNNIARDEAILWVLEHKAEKQFVGSICLWNISADGKEAEIGYELLPPSQGMGYMQEALLAIINYAFEVMQLEKLVAVLHPGNLKSVNLLRKNGFVCVQEEDEEGMAGYVLLKYAAH